MRLGGASKGPLSNVIPHLRTDFWDASQARLAHLLPTGDMKVLAPYYEQIRMLKELDDIAAKDDPRQLSDSEWTPMQGTQDRGFAVSQMAQGYVQDLEYRNLADVIATLRNGTGGRLFGSAPLHTRNGQRDGIVGKPGRKPAASLTAVFDCDCGPGPP